MHREKRPYESPWASGVVLYLEPPLPKAQEVWPEVSPALFPEEPSPFHGEGESLKLLEGWLESLPEKPTALFRQDAHPFPKAHLLFYGLAAPAGRGAVLFAWRELAPAPPSWRHGEPPPEELFALFRRGRKLLSGLTPPEVKALWEGSLRLETRG